MEGVTATALAEEIGERLKQARLNRDLTQSEVAELAGVARKTVLNAEKGKVQLNIMIAILMALDLTEQIDLFLPKQEISPLQLAKLQGKKRQRASGQRGKKASHYENTQLYRLLFPNTPNIPIHHKRLNQPAFIIHFKTNTTAIFRKK